MTITTPLDSSSPAAASGTFTIGGDLPVHRIGYGTMQLTGPGHWYHPAEIDGAKAVLRRAVDLGINHLDTADAYGPETVEHLIRKALHPYPEHLVIATKGGLTRQGPDRWAPVGRPEYLRQCVEMSLRRLAVDRIDLYYLHRVDPRVPLEDQIGVLADLQDEGKIHHLGLSKVTVEQIEAAREITPIVAVQNKFNMLEGDDDVLDHCIENDIAFVPYAPLAAGVISLSAGVALRWLLDLAPNVLPIPGTTSLQHLEDNLHLPAPLEPA
ncbi:aldo/keto reductase [Antribacter sp. KLBMP9083]|uniref:Aldo/keto reductase n=1 Tax=Antribacter soli TaxID=2910976 RepID=A0AA41QH42_9MICO|nr:aldo/keto reductase [Antribacter soli]MCF4123008.1 aldo/keto reductase [Antribacter soli]